MIPNYAVVTRLGPPLERRIALCFTGNENPIYLQEVLDILAINNSLAVFFLPENWLKHNAALIKLLLNKKHELGGVTPNLNSAPAIKPAETILEIKKFWRAVQKLELFPPPTLFRLSKQQYNRSILEQLYQLNYANLIIPTIEVTKQNSLNRFWINLFKPGTIVNFDLADPKTIVLLPRLLLKAKQLNYSLLKLSELLAPINRQDKYESRISLPGQTMFDLGQKFGVDPKLLGLLNQWSTNTKLLPYQVIYLPLKDSPYVYTVLTGDTIENISAKFGLVPESLTDLNGALAVKTLYPGQQILLPQAQNLYYTIQKDDTLHLISQRLAVPLYELIVANPQLIEPGQKLKISSSYTTQKNRRI